MLDRQRPAGREGRVPWQPIGTGGGPDGGLAPGVRLCYVDYWEESDLVDHLRHNVPAGLKRHLRFRPARTAPTDPAGRIVYPQGTGAIQLRPGAAPDGAGLKVCFWHPGAGAPALTPFEIWFSEESLRFCQSRAARRPSALSAAAGPAPPPAVESERAELQGGLVSPGPPRRRGGPRRRLDRARRRPLPPPGLAVRRPRVPDFRLVAQNPPVRSRLPPLPFLSLNSR
jgi:hypothetical protein